MSKNIVTLLCLSVVFAVPRSMPASPVNDKKMDLFWCFLVTGKPTAGVEADELNRMQRAHLANFGRLAAEGTLLTAGPLRDPEGKLRGIVVVKAADRIRIADMFKADPYVTNGN